MSRRWRIRLILVALSPLALLLLDRVFVLVWTGATDVEAEFVITDATTGRPIPGARVVTQRYEDYEEGDKPREDELWTDAAGTARVTRRGCIVDGETGCILGITWNYWVDVSCFRFRVEADGYDPRPWELVRKQSPTWDIRPVRPRLKRITVPAALAKSNP